jgi:hypothetical protein
MSTRNFVTVFARLTAAVLCLAVTAGCGGELLRTGRGPVYLTVVEMLAHNGALDEEESVLFSDVLTYVEQTVNGQQVKVPTVFSDTGVATIRVSMKNPTALSSDLNSVTITRYRVDYRRSDGRNTPGSDVPYGFEAGTSATIGVDEEGEVPFDLVRHVAKQEPPLRNLVANGGQGFIYTTAEVTFYGRDQNGNEIVITGFITVNFADFGDPE